MKISDLERLVKFPALSRIEGNRLSCSIGLSDWSTNIRSSIEEEKMQLNHFVQIQLLKGHEDIKYEVVETEREILIRYHWKEYDPKEDDEIDWDAECEEKTVEIVDCVK